VEVENGTLEELRDRLSWMIDFNATQTDQDFRGPSSKPNKRVDDELNLAYRREVEEAKKVRELWFLRLHQFTWPASAATLDIPEGLVDKRIFRIRDNTDHAVGPILEIWDQGSNGTGFYIYDNDTWGWYPAPSSARTLVAEYLADATWMKAATDQPSLIPKRHREMIPLSAAINMHRTAPITDTATFTSWEAHLAQLRFNWHKEIARGKVAEHPPARIRNAYPDINEQH
jgi:hypothetical protein